MNLRHLRPGLRFSVRGLPTLTGTLLKVSDCRAVVRYDRAPEYVHFTTADGRECEFERIAGPTSISPFTEVESR